jgi:hypothetical protein
LRRNQIDSSHVGALFAISMNPHSPARELLCDVAFAPLFPELAFTTRRSKREADVSPARGVHGRIGAVLVRHAMLRLL